jgi:large subunit ribosomal protein L4
VDAVNTYDLMYADRLLISESALSILETQLNK